MGSLVIVIVASLAVAWLACRAQADRRARPACLLVAAGVAGLAMAAGARVEHEWQVSDRARSLLFPAPEPSPRPASGAGNDPGLLGQLAVASPANPASATEPVAWRAGQAEFRARLANRFGFRGTPGTTAIGGYREREDGGLLTASFAFRSPDGTWIPGVLQRPRDRAPLGAIVVIPGHVRPGESGLAQLTGGADSYQHRAARALAEAGFLTLALELRGFGTLGPPRHPEHEQVAYNALLAGTFYKALVVADVAAAVDYLLSRPDVSPERLGITGASLGGEIAVAYAALDTRIRAVAFHSYGGSLGPFRGIAGNQGLPHYCHLIPGSGRDFRQEDVFQLLAPRPTQALRGESQPFRNPAFASALGRAWQAGGDAGALEFGNAPGGHEYFVEPAVKFFRRVFPTPYPQPSRKTS